MAQAAEQTTIDANPVGIRCMNWKKQVVFRDPTTGERFTVEGMTVKGGKGAWARYNRMFKGRTFTISLNEGGQGVHYAEGIRWDDSIREWVDVPKPESYLWVKQVSRWTYKTKCLVEHVWDPSSFVWEENSIDLPDPLYQSISGNSRLKCWDCYSGKMECKCPFVLDIRQIVENISCRIEANICGRCFQIHTTPYCLSCSGNYIKSSLVGIEPHCPICLSEFSESSLDESSLDECVAVKGAACGHSFHLHCIEEWRNIHNTCPMCRAAFPPINDNCDDEYSDDEYSDDGYLHHR